jgi:hypothetical protein
MEKRMAEHAREFMQGAGIALLFGVAIVATARADVVYEQQITSSGPAGPGPSRATNTVYVKSEWERSEMTVMAPAPGQATAGENQLISITRLDRELIWYLDPANKVYNEMPFAALRSSLAEPAAGARDSTGQADRPAGEVRIERPGRKDVICGAPAELVVLTIASPLADPTLRGASQYVVAELWMATDFPGAAELAAHAKATVDAVGFARIGPTSAGNPFSHLMKRLAEEMRNLDGTAIRTVMSLEIDAEAGVAGLTSPVPAHGEGRQVIVAITTEMTKVESKNVPAALFEIPAGYVKVESPAPGK